jgi:hypothetical protein
MKRPPNLDFFFQKSVFYVIIGLNVNYEKTVVAQNKSNLLLKNYFYNMLTLQLIQLKMV